MVIDKSKIIIRPENPSEYEEVSQIPRSKLRGMIWLLSSKSASRGGVFDPRAVAKCKQACVWLVAYARIK